MTAAETSAKRNAVTVAPYELRYLVLAAQREGNRALNRQLRECGLTTSQFEIILVLGQYEPITLKTLGELIVCETGSPSRIVDALVGRGLIERGTDEKDRRAVSLQLTDSGRGMIPMLQTLDKAMDRGAYEALSAEDLRGLVGALRTYLTGTESGNTLDRRFNGSRVRLT